ncbi:6,7-dimethyl-8-ribityllumazine synthase [Candidatus Woesearchaeota archaeon]|nr:6,7-dimethyl-8-ribityllumazine synthase [Candidatus Woesearchaeota archaeon]
MTGIAIVATEINPDIIQPMLLAARAQAQEDAVSIMEVILVPGCFEMPLAVKALLKRADVDGIVTLGAILRGETAHDSIVGESCAHALVSLSLEYEKPVTHGVAGPGATRDQALARTEEYARRAVHAAVVMIKRMKEMQR